MRSHAGSAFTVAAPARPCPRPTEFVRNGSRSGMLSGAANYTMERAVTMDTTLAESYERLLQECRSRGELLGAIEGDDRRRHPRVRVRPDRLPQPLSPWRLAVDISATGMAFFADEPCDAGRPIRIALGEHLAVDADVLACQEVPLEVLHDPTRYRVRCRFTDEQQGLRMLLAVKEMEGQRGEAG